MAVKINIDKVFEQMSKRWKRIGTLAAQWIGEDARKGIFQNNTSGYKYSEQYAKYKANNMRRFTDNKRLKNYYATSISSTDTSKVNMTLTGQTLKGLKVRTIENNGVTLGYEPADAKKIIGNRVHGYDIVGLNSANIDKVKDELVKGFSEEFKKLMKDKIVIEVKL